MENNQHDKLVETKLDKILEVLEQLFIIEAAKANVPSGAIRGILKINNNRVAAVTKHVKG